ncbi:MAG: DUF3805 domain-containing protein [Bacteroidetes bacterium]|nr:MAG: DUF3805 domain-containing protein [Bacteroidota bacterium]
MKNLVVSCLFLLFGTASLQAQTAFSQWDIFKTDRFGFSMKYPDSWVMNEKGNGDYTFKNEVAERGSFRLWVEEKSDSSEAVSVLKSEETANAGARFSALNDRCMVVYKTMSLLRGKDMETHHWTIAYKNKVLHCSFTYEAKKRTDANLKDEIVLAYQMIESITFYKP